MSICYTLCVTYLLSTWFNVQDGARLIVPDVDQKLRETQKCYLCMYTCTLYMHVHTCTCTMYNHDMNVMRSSLQLSSLASCMATRNSVLLYICSLSVTLPSAIVCKGTFSFIHAGLSGCPTLKMIVWAYYIQCM